MTYLLPSGSGDEAQDRPKAQIEQDTAMTDLKIFWGPDICRLEYLVHLLDTGRIKDERSKAPVHSV